MKIKKYALLTLILTGQFINSQACTIFSGKDKNGHVWVGNNEDMIFYFKTRINLVKSTDSTFGYAFFTYDVNNVIQGGVNDAGLFFDFNSVPSSKAKDYDKKKDFPGGYEAMMLHVLKKCKTVQEVLTLFKKYRLTDNRSSQMHLADKFGNLGIIVADSMWITKSNYQVSTNYNLCHSDKDKMTCWRMPIAERILKSKEPGLETFREICDSTSQKVNTSTIYSNIHDLTTGDIWFYYGMDYTKSYKTNINELLKKGTSSFYVYELFTNDPLVAVYKTYQDKGIESGLKKLNEYQLSLERKNEILRLLCSDLIVWNHDFNSYPFLSALLKSKKDVDELLQVTNPIALFFSSKKTEALDILNKYPTDHPTGQLAPFASQISNQMQGIFEKDANVKFELKGYENAKSVFVEGIDYPTVIYFLIQKDGKWIGDFYLDPDEYHYVFLVDGKRVLDANISDTIKENGLDYSKIVVKE